MVMDKSAAQSLEARWDKRAKQQGEKSREIAAGSAKPLYVQDLEERARRRNIPVAQVYEHDQQLLSQARPTSECLRPDEVMQCAQDERELPLRAFEHHQQCLYCQGLVAAARPDVARFRKLVAQLAAPENGAADAPASEARVVRWNDALFARLDKSIRPIMKFGGLVAASFLMVFYFSSDAVRTKAPIWTWSDRLLEQSAVQAAREGETTKADALASDLISRDPANPGWHLLRSHIRLQAGEKVLAKRDFKSASQLMAPTGGTDMAAEHVEMMTDPAAAASDSSPAAPAADASHE
jgi:hypothetical protein